MSLHFLEQFHFHCYLPLQISERPYLIFPAPQHSVVPHAKPLGGRTHIATARVEEAQPIPLATALSTNLRDINPAPLNHLSLCMVLFLVFSSFKQNSVGFMVRGETCYKSNSTLLFLSGQWSFKRNESDPVTLKPKPFNSFQLVLGSRRNSWHNPQGFHEPGL